MRILIAATLTAGLTTNAQAQRWDDCKYKAERNANVDVGTARLLQIEAGSGSLKIEGKTGLARVVIRGRACASDKDLLDEINLEARREGDGVVVRANVHRDEDNRSWRNNSYRRLDVVMEVPAGMAANIDDGSGEIDLSNLGAIDLDDGSGGITADNIGAIRIQDGSGEIRLSRVDGTVDIEDGSGEITVRVAKGTVRVSDSSGSIDVSDVGGDFIVTHDGSGGIDYDNVKGRVDVPRRRR